MEFYEIIWYNLNIRVSILSHLLYSKKEVNLSYNLMNNIDYYDNNKVPGYPLGANGSVSGSGSYKVGIYIRLSREDEEKESYEESESVQNQRTLLMQYLTQNKLNFVAEYVDDGVSGTSFDRPSFNRMIADIEAGKINMVVTKDLSRLGRDYIMSGYYTEKYFPEHSIRFIAILDNIDTAFDSSNNDIAPFKSILNEMYAKDISKKINSVLQSKRDLGQYLGTAPYGYKKDPENKYHLIIDDEAAEVVRLIYKKYLEGFGTMQIADYLTNAKIPIPSDYTKRKRGVRSLTYGYWQQSTVRFILSNEVYTGTIVQGKRKKVSFKSKKFIDLPEEDWIKVEDMHEAIISKEDFARAKKIIEATKGSRVVQNDYLFKGLIRCFDCKGYIGIRTPDKNGNIYGRCQRYGRFGKFDVCSPHNFNYQVFEEQMISVLREIFKEYKDKKRLEEIAKLSKNKKAKKIDFQKQIDSFKEAIEKEKIKLEVMYEDRLNGIISLEDYMKNANKIKELVKEYENTIKELEANLKGEKVESKEDKLDNLIDEFLNMEKPTKEIIREFINKIEIHEDKQVDVYFNFKPLQELNENFNKFKCAKKKYESKTA